MLEKKLWNCFLATTTKIVLIVQKILSVTFSLFVKNLAWILKDMRVRHRLILLMTQTMQLLEMTVSVYFVANAYLFVPKDRGVVQ